MTKRAYFALGLWIGIAAGAYVSLIGVSLQQSEPVTQEVYRYTTPSPAPTEGEPNE